MPNIAEFWLLIKGETFQSGKIGIIGKQSEMSYVKYRQKAKADKRCR